MTGTGGTLLPLREGPEQASPRLALASRGDALTPYLFDALQRRFPTLGRIDPELTAQQRLLVAGLTVRPTRARWQERFYKSEHARSLRSANARRQLARLPRTPDVVFQVHLLFDVTTAPAVVYVDCTHRQSAEQWPEWNPLSGRALEQWYRREADAYHAARHLFAFSEPTRDSLVLDYGVPADRVTVVGAGANLDALPAPRPAGERSAQPTILFVGNDFVRKGGPVLLEAFRRVRRTVPDARLRLVGALPPVRPEPGVEVLGRIRDRGRLEALYREADVFALPSHFDPYPLVLLEAMAFGVPVVATAQTGVPEILADGQAGVLVEPGRVDRLADALLRVLRDPAEAGRLGAAGRSRVAAQLTWDRVVERMAPALDALVDGDDR